MSGAARASLADAIRASGLIEPGSGGVVLCSGGPDSAGLAAGLAELCGAGGLLALHLNYGLRGDSGEDERACVELCELLGLELAIERPSLPAGGNLQARARDARYASAERLRLARGLDWVAAGHTRTDLAETVLYRLATSPGTRPLLGLPARRDALVRPLLGIGRERLHELVRAAGLPFHRDPSNEGPAYARNRIRSEVLPVLAELGPALEETIAETQAELREEADALRALALEALEAEGALAAGAISGGRLERLAPAIRRLALRALAERTTGRRPVVNRERAAEITRLTADPEGGVVELGSGVEARIEQGMVRFAAAPEAEVPDVTLTVPGSCRFGRWEVTAELRREPGAPSGPGAAHLDPAALSQTLVVRSWRDGDRIRPLGLDGSKSLQDLFTDRRVPRSLRRTLPVVTSDGRIAWIAGVAVSQEFAAEPGSAPAAVLNASQGSPSGDQPLH